MSAPTQRRGVHRWGLALLAGLGAAAATTGELAVPVDDAWHAARAAAHAGPARPPALVVGVDDASLEALGPWPWRRDVLATALQRLQQAGVDAVALDLPLEAADLAAPDGDARLARLLPGSGTVLGVRLRRDDHGRLQAHLPAPEFAEAARLGHVRLEPGRDGRVRHHQALLVAEDGTRWPSMASLLLPADPASKPTGAHQWRIPPLPAGAQPAYRSFHDLLAGRVDGRELRGRPVLFGLASTRLATPTPGPFGTAPAFPVEHQARALEARARGVAARPMHIAFQGLLAFLLAGGGMLAGLHGQRDTLAWRLPVVLLATAVASMALSATLLARQWWWGPAGTVAVLGVIVLGHVLLMLRRRLRARRRLPGLVSHRRLRAAARAAPFHALVKAELQPSGGDAAAPARWLRLAELLRARARRPGDLVALAGPGRFVLLLPDTGQEAATRLLEGLREDASQAGIPLQGQAWTCTDGHCTCNSGSP